MLLAGVVYNGILQADGTVFDGYITHFNAETFERFEGSTATLCGWLTMAKAFPNSQFIGYDFHLGSIEAARKHAAVHGVTDNVIFEVGSAKDFAATGLDLVTFFDCLHDMGDPAGAAAHVCRSLKKDGSWMIVEPMAADSLEENLNPVSRLYYAALTMICIPTSLSQEIGTALGAQAGEAKLREVITAGGFASVRRAAETPFNIDSRGAALTHSVQHTCLSKLATNPQIRVPVFAIRNDRSGRGVGRGHICKPTFASSCGHP